VAEPAMAGFDPAKLYRLQMKREFVQQAIRARVVQED